MKNMSKIGSNVSDKANFIKAKTEEFIRNIDCKINIDRMEEEMDELYMDIGEMVCRYLDAGETPNFTGGMREKYRKVCMLRKNVISRKKIINANANAGRNESIYCENCGEILHKGHSFCHICGNKLHRE